MSESIRNRFRGAKLSNLQDTIKEAKSKSYSQNERPGFHNVTKEPGVYKLRIAPPHNVDTGVSFRPIRTTFLKCELPKLDENKKEIEGEVEIRGKKVFIATMHGDSIEKDPVELYIEHVKKQVYDQYQDKDERQKRLIPITGNFKKGKDNIPGITPQTNYVAYAWMNGRLGRVEVYQSIMNKIEELNIAEQSDEEIKIDIFADPVEPIFLVIDNDPSRGSKQRYIVSKESPNFAKYLKEYKNKEEAIEKYEKACEGYKVSDEQLKELLEKESLEELYVNVYTKRDFDLALNGLKIFDEQNEYKIFENEEFLKELEEIEKQVPEKTEKENSNEEKDVEDNFKKTQEEQEESVQEDYTKWSKIKCRKHLEAYILENYGNDAMLPEKVEGDLDVLRKWVELSIKEEELPFEDYQEQEKDDSNEKQEGSSNNKEDVKEEKDLNPDLRAKLEKLKNKSKKG
jgi:hypothetical protein